MSFQAYLDKIKAKTGKTPVRLGPRSCDGDLGRLQTETLGLLSLSDSGSEHSAAVAPATSDPTSARKSPGPSRGTSIPFARRSR